MNNIEWLEHIKREEKCWLDNRKNELRNCYELRRVKALEIIAEELCKINNPLIKVEMLKPKIRVRNLNKYMKKTSI